MTACVALASVPAAGAADVEVSTASTFAGVGFPL